MRLLVTGDGGYIGRILVPLLQAAGHDVAGLDSGLFEGCDFGPPVPATAASRRMDIRDISADELTGFDAVLHLAGISNDPLGDLAPEVTFDVNWRSSVRLARLARQAGVSRFLYASSCSNYGASGGDELLDETAPFNPITPYAVSKVKVEAELHELADASFSPVYLRAATAYGVSPRLRGDLVVNNLVGYAVTTGEVLIKSDGTPWRPLVHVEDIARAYVALVAAPREAIHDQAFNVGRTSENYRVREVAEIVAETVPGARVTFAPGASPDSRNYRVSCEKIARSVPAYRPTWTVREGVEQLYRAYLEHELSAAEFLSSRFLRVNRVREHIGHGALDDGLRWRKLAA